MPLPCGGISLAGTAYVWGTVSAATYRRAACFVSARMSEVDGRLSSHVRGDDVQDCVVLLIQSFFVDIDSSFRPILSRCRHFAEAGRD